MYSEQIEQLIKSVIADGVITEKERAVLHKRAVAEGIDEDEIDVYVEGLIALMKSDAPKSEVPAGKAKQTRRKSVPKSVNIDFKYIGKSINKKGNTFYQGQNWLKIETEPECDIEKIYLNFFKSITDEGKTSMGISFAFVFCNNRTSSLNYPRLILKPDTASFDLGIVGQSWDSCIPHKPSTINTNGQEIVIEIDMSDQFLAYPIDEEMLKLICDAEQISISLIDCGSMNSHSWSDEKRFDIRDLDADDLATYAQIFYRSIVDNKAYPDAAISEFKYPKAAKKLFGKLKNFFDD